jgi:D-glycerate 3-kinase
LPEATSQDWFSRFMADEALPVTFGETVRLICEPLAARAAALRQARGRSVLIGLCGAQGSGKTTIAAATGRLLAAQGLSVVSVSLDDFYLPRSARRRLALRVHPLLATRGPPGTHDVGLAAAVLDALHTPMPVSLPAFDKAADEPRPQDAWRTVEGPIDVILFEGWCVGARPEEPIALALPVNDLEAQEDPQGVWRAYVNAALDGPYQGLFARLDALALLQAPSFEMVLGWRLEQEHKLIARAGRGMSDQEVARFIAQYERLTRWVLAEMPARADMVFPLGPDRRPITKG